jgi:predicted MPP superfamily phosphohydrolase
LTTLETPENANLPGIPRAGFFRAFADYWWGSYTKISVTRYEIETPKVERTSGLKIAFVSDIHADTQFMPAKRIREVVAKTNALEADLIVLGGDYSTQNNWRMTPLPLDETIGILSGLTAPHGVVAIMGNHDWWDDTDTQHGSKTEPETARLMRDVGIMVMSNKAHQLEHPSGIWLAALESQMAFERHKEPHEGAHDLDQALTNVPTDTFNILLAHEPDIFAELAGPSPRVPVDLTLCGHTHGGQIRLFGARPVIPSAYGARYAYGHLHDDGRDLIVSGGLGCSSIPVRLGVLPEIVLVTVKGTG